MTNYTYLRKIVKKESKIIFVIATVVLLFFLGRIFFVDDDSVTVQSEIEIVKNGLFSEEESQDLIAYVSFYQNHYTMFEEQFWNNNLRLIYAVKEKSLIEENKLIVKYSLTNEQAQDSMFVLSRFNSSIENVVNSYFNDMTVVKKTISKSNRETQYMRIVEYIAVTVSISCGYIAFASIIKRVDRNDD